MSYQYRNFVAKIEGFNMIVLTTEDEYIENKASEKYPELSLQCERGHQFIFRVLTKFKGTCQEKCPLIINTQKDKGYNLDSLSIV